MFGPDPALFDTMAFAAPASPARLRSSGLEFKPGWQFFDSAAKVPAPSFGARGEGELPGAAGGEAAHSAAPAPEIAAEPSVFDGDFLIVGVGVIALPSYEGSNDTAIIPSAAFAGRIKGVGINARAAGVSLDFIPDRPGASIGFGLGPVVRYRSNRSARIKDPVVESLGKLHGVVEGGVSASVTFRHVFNPHDQLSVGSDIRWDISGHNGGRVITPSVNYLTPLSHAQVFGVQVSAEFADAAYAHYNFDVSAAGSLASGLPGYSAHGGLKTTSVGVFTARDLNDNLLDGGLALAVGAMYSKLHGSAAESPVTSIRGKRDQWIVGAGAAYVF